MKLKLRAVGTSTGVVLPKELLVTLKVKKGDELFVVERPGGCILTPFDPDIEEQVRLGLEFMEKHRDAFRALAK